jgi:hypothetical protein
VALLLALAGCASAVMARHGPSLSTRGWVLLPLMNYSETPHAAEAVQAILSTLLHARNVNAADAPGATDSDQPMPELDERRRLESAIAWARERKLALGLTGSVNEWRYRGSSDSRPAVGLTLSAIDLQSGEVLWTASGARSGSGGDTVSGTAQRLLQELLDGMEMK